MVQWITLIQYNGFVIRWQLLLLCEKTETIMLVLPGLMADEIVLNSENFWMKCSSFLGI